MANSSIYDFLDTFDQILRYNNNMGSVTLYMATGGTNFGYTAGALPERAAALGVSGMPPGVSCLSSDCPRCGVNGSSEVTSAFVDREPGYQSWACACVLVW